MSNEKQIAEMCKVLLESKAVSYEPNVCQIDLYGQPAKEKFHVSERDGHLTIDYKVFATELYRAGYRKASDVVAEIFAEIEQVLMCGSNDELRLAVRIAELKKKRLEDMEEK